MTNGYSWRRLLSKRLSVCLLMVLLAQGPFGCAKYKAGSLAVLQPEFAPYSETVESVTLAAKKLDSGDCKRLFDRDVISKGYQPIQITVHNDTKKFILFSPQGISLPVVPAQEVAEKCHTSTAGRATAYGVGGLILWPLLIPAVVDGVGSSKANDQLDRDFEAKTVDQVVIQPYATHNGIIFVPVADYQNSFGVILVDKETREKLEYRVVGLDR